MNIYLSDWLTFSSLPLIYEKETLTLNVLGTNDDLRHIVKGI